MVKQQGSAARVSPAVSNDGAESLERRAVPGAIDRGLVSDAELDAAGAYAPLPEVSEELIEATLGRVDDALELEARRNEDLGAVRRQQDRAAMTRAPVAPAKSAALVGTSPAPAKR